MGVWAPACTAYFGPLALAMPHPVVPFPSNDDLLMSLPSFITGFW